MKKETYVAPVMEIVLLEREKTVLTSGNCVRYIPGYCPAHCPMDLIPCTGDCGKHCPDDCGGFTPPCPVDGFCPADGICPVDGFCPAYGICPVEGP